MDQDTQSTAAGHRERLRQRFLAGEEESRTDEALLELLLSYAIPQKDIRPLVMDLTSEFGSLSGVLAAAPERLTGVQGIKSYSATLLKLVDFIRSRQAPVSSRDTIPATRDGTRQEPLFHIPSEPTAPSPQTAGPGSHPHVINRRRSGIFGKAVLEEAIAALPDLPDTQVLGEIREYLRANLHFSAVETRHRYSNYITRRVFPNGIADKALRYFARRYRSSQDLRDVCFYRFCKAEPLMTEVASDLLMPSMGAGNVSRAQLRQYLSGKFPAAKSIGDCAKAIVDALVAGGLARADAKSLTFAYRNPLIASFAFVLHSEFPEPGMYDIGTLEKDDAVRAMLWNPDRILPALYELRNQELISKVSEIDNIRQFTTKFTLEQVVERLADMQEEK